MFGGRSAAYPQADTPTTRQVFGTDYRRKKVERKINPATGCYCDFVHRMTGDGCDICNPEYADELRKEAELESAKNTEQANQPGSGE